MWPGPAAERPGLGINHGVPAKWLPPHGQVMRLVITKAQAFRAARTYANEYDVPWVGVVGVQAFREWWPFTPQAYQFDIDTGGEGRAVATVGLPFRGVQHFEFRPHDPARFWLPPWAAFPYYTAGTMGWRQGSGEVYLTDWYGWFHDLSAERQAAYRGRFPEPDRNGWLGFYEGYK